MFNSMNKVIITSFWTLAVFAILFSNNSSYPILGYNTNKTISYLFPQGWGFFTKDPKEVAIDVYQLEGETLKLISVNNFSVQNLLGLSREARYIGFEFGRLGQYIPKTIYKNETGDVSKIYPSTTTIVKIPFLPKFYPIGKEFVVYQYKIVPFAWINQNQEQYRPYLVARIKLEYDSSVSLDPQKYFEKTDKLQ